MGRGREGQDRSGRKRGLWAGGCLALEPLKHHQALGVQADLRYCPGRPQDLGSRLAHTLPVLSSA